MQDYIRIKPTRGQEQRGIPWFGDRPGDWLYKARAMRARRLRLLKHKLRAESLPAMERKDTKSKTGWLRQVLP